MKRIGLLSDTHGYLDSVIFDYFSECDEVWHAGDIGCLSIGEKLASFKLLRAVHGNIDGVNIRKHYPHDQHFTCEGMRVWMTHITGRPNQYTPYVLKNLKIHQPAILVGGHSHILCVKKDQWGSFYLNPGAAGREGFHQVRTILRFSIDKGHLSNMEAIEL